MFNILFMRRFWRWHLKKSQCYCSFWCSTSISCEGLADGTSKWQCYCISWCSTSISCKVAMDTLKSHFYFSFWCKEKEEREREREREKDREKEREREDLQMWKCEDVDLQMRRCERIRLCTAVGGWLSNNIGRANPVSQIECKTNLSKCKFLNCVEHAIYTFSTPLPCWLGSASWYWKTTELDSCGSGGLRVSFGCCLDH